MRDIRASNVTRRAPRAENITRRTTIDRCICDRRDRNKRDIGCQYEIPGNRETARYRNTRYFSSVPKQIYTYHRISSFIDVGVGNVSIITAKKKVKKIYLAETVDTGVGSTDLTPFIAGKGRHGYSYYDNKKTSSKCVGGIVMENNVCNVNEKLSPIIRKRSGTTNTTVAKTTSDQKIKDSEFKSDSDKLLESPQNPKLVVDHVKTTGKGDFLSKSSLKSYQFESNKSVSPKVTENIPDNVSSVSMVQKVHNLEDIDESKQSKISIDPMENQIEKEYRKIFSITSKDRKKSNHKPFRYTSTSFLKRRFEDLRRRSIGKRDDRDKNSFDDTTYNQITNSSHKDVSIASDPPSLECHSYSSVKPYSPYESRTNEISTVNPKRPFKKQVRKNEPVVNIKWPRHDTVDGDYNNVKGMFRLWGKKFNFDENSYYQREYSKASILQYQLKGSEGPKKDSIEVNEREIKVEDLKYCVPEERGQRFSFFRKKSKNKPYTHKERKDITTNRCEIKDGLTVKFGSGKETTKLCAEDDKSIDEKLRFSWLNKFMTSAMDAKNSVHIRWNNRSYGTSSSTIFELIDNVYKDTGIIFRSRSDIGTNDKTNYAKKVHQGHTKSHKRRVNFLQQDVQAFVVQALPHEKNKYAGAGKSDNHQIVSKQKIPKWKIDRSNLITVMIQSKTIQKYDQSKPYISSEYLYVDIPKGFFSDSCDDELIYYDDAESNEQVYKIVEYDPKGSFRKGNIVIEVDDNNVKEDKEYSDNTIKEKYSGYHRDSVTEDSNVNISQRCDVVGVGIINQRDKIDKRKLVLKICDESTETDSEPDLQNTGNKFEFAESYLQECYENGDFIGTDLFKWNKSDSHLTCNPENNFEGSSHSKCAGSCPNIYKEYRGSAFLSSWDTLKCNEGMESGVETCCHTVSVCSNQIGKLKKKKDTKLQPFNTKRVCPKESLEVLKKRMLNATGNRGKWFCDDFTAKQANANVKGRQVKMWDDEGACNYTPEGILSYKGDSSLSKEPKKHATVEPTPSCIIPQPECKEYCETKKKPLCLKKKIKNRDCQLPRCYGMPAKLSKTSNTMPQTDPIACCKRPVSKSSSICSNSSRYDSIDICERPSCQRITNEIMKKSESQMIKPRVAIDSGCSSDVHIPEPLPEMIRPRVAINSGCSSNVHIPEPLCKPPSRESSHSGISLVKRPSPPCLVTPSPPRTPTPTIIPRSTRTPSPQTSSSPVRCISPPQSPPISPRKSRTKKRSINKVCPHCSTRIRCPVCASQLPGKKRSGPICPHCSSKVKCPHCSSDISVKNSTSHPKRTNQSKLPSPERSPRHVATDCPPSYKSTNWSPPSSPPRKVSRQNSPCHRSKSPKLRQRTSTEPLEKCKTSEKIPNTFDKKRNECGEALELINSVMSCPGHSDPSSQELSQVNLDSHKGRCLEGIHLKITKKARKTQSSPQRDPNKCIRLNSTENMPYRTKANTPSTEEIRGDNCIKVQDEDGRTLYERKDYKRDVQRQCVVGDIFRDSKQNRMVMTVSGEDSGKYNKEMNTTAIDSDTSVANEIEINFKIKLKQGDKDTISNTVNNDTNKNVSHYAKNALSHNANEIYMMGNDTDLSCEERNLKNNLNIKILIKNFKDKDKKKKSNTNIKEDFCKKISDKFHTVGIGYSGEMNADEPNAYSVHRATVDLTSSVELSKPPLIAGCERSDFKPSFCHCVYEKNSILSKNESIIRDHNGRKTTEVYKVESNRQYDENHCPINSMCETEETDSCIYGMDDDSLPDSIKKCVKEVYSSKSKKKRAFKKLMEEASKAGEDESKTHVDIMKNRLKRIMTSGSSDPDDYEATRKNKAKNESLTNYLELDSVVSGINDTSKQSDFDSLSKNYQNEDDVDNGDCRCKCVCSTMADKLQLARKFIEDSGCPCTCRTNCCKRNEETICDMNSKDSVTSEEGIKIADVSTQYSKTYTGLKKKPHKMITVHVIQNTPENMKQKVYSPPKNFKKACAYKSFNDTPLSVTSDDKIILVDNENIKQTKISTGKFEDKTSRSIKHQSDILQCYETKKAVLELYTERTTSERGERLVAKLPQFVHYYDAGSS